MYVHLCVRVSALLCVGTCVNAHALRAHGCVYSCMSVCMYECVCVACAVTIPGPGLAPPCTPTAWLTPLTRGSSIVFNESLGTQTWDQS